MISDHFDRIFIINLPLSLKRRALALYQIGKLQLINAEIIKAVEGRNIDLEAMKAEGQLEWDDWNKRDLSHGEVGCYLSHVSVWNSIISLNIKTALICEDDIIWRPDAHKIADGFMAEVPDDWDIIHFHSYVRVASGEQNDPERKRLSAHVLKGCSEGRGSACYAITMRGAQFLMGKAFPIRYTLDGVTNKLTLPKRNREYHGYVCDPFLCDISNVPSEIDMRGSR